MIKHTKNKVLVTGAAGFVGSYICDLLLKKGYEVIGLYHSNKEKVRHLMQKKNFYLIKGNLADFAEISRILKKVKPHGVFHTAALHSPKPINSPFPFFEANVRGTLNLLESCRLLNIKKFYKNKSKNAVILNYGLYSTIFLLAFCGLIAII